MVLISPAIFQEEYLHIAFFPSVQFSGSPVHGAAGGALELVHCELRKFLLGFKSGLQTGYVIKIILCFP
jgi:hypothetical protein